MTWVTIFFIGLWVVSTVAYLQQRDTVTRLRRALDTCETEQRLAPRFRVGDTVRFHYAGEKRVGVITQIAFSKTYRVRFPVENSVGVTAAMDEHFLEGVKT